MRFKRDERDIGHLRVLRDRRRFEAPTQKKKRKRVDNQAASARRRRNARSAPAKMSMGDGVMQSPQELPSGAGIRSKTYLFMRNRLGRYIASPQMVIPNDEDTVRISMEPTEELSEEQVEMRFKRDERDIGHLRVLRDRRRFEAPTQKKKRKRVDNQAASARRRRNARSAPAKVA